MSNTSSATPLPPSDGGTNTNPNLSVVPPGEPQRRVPGELNLRQVRDVERAKQIALAAQKSAYAPTLDGRGITPQFVTTLLNDITVAVNRGSSAIQHTTSKEVATRQEDSAEDKLVTSLRDLQNAARQLHLHSNPEKLKDYLVGERITSSRGVLDQSAQVILTKANEERPPGVDTGVVVRVQGELNAFNQLNQTQQNEQTTAQNERVARDNLVASIKQRAQQIQLAADRAWPWRDPSNAGVRREFYLPANRTYTA